MDQGPAARTENQLQKTLIDSRNLSGFTYCKSSGCIHERVYHTSYENVTFNHLMHSLAEQEIVPIHLRSCSRGES
jgi:hypothetical protein